MFYNPVNLTDSQKLVYIRMLIFLAKSDKNPNFIEKDFIKKIIARFQLNPALMQNLTVPNDFDDLPIVLQPINNYAVAVDLLHCLWFATSIDSKISDEEVRIIRCAAKILGIDDDTLLKINDFVLDEIMFIERTHEILKSSEIRFA
ncbi:MAG: hypothetical protein IJ770_04810 [Alphaproteobacteria bacterium]|nr:hypothetical protein [Alphaproteobacteria bacterium]